MARPGESSSLAVALNNQPPNLVDKSLCLIDDECMQSSADSTTKPLNFAGMILITVLIFCLTYISVYGAHHEIVDVKALAAGDIDRMHADFMNGKAESPTQYRPLSYRLAELTRPIYSGDLFLTYLLNRFIFTFLSGLLLMRFLKRYLGFTWALAGTAFFYAMLPWAYLGYHHQPADPINLFLFILAYNLVADGKPWWLVPVVGIGMANRETVILLPVFDLLLSIDKRPIGGHLLRFGLSIISGLVVYAIIYSHYGPRAHPDPFIMLWTNLRDPWLIGSAFVFLLPPLVIALAGWGGMPRFHRRAFYFSILFIANYLVFGYFREMRLFTPILPLLLLCALHNIKRWFEPLGTVPKRPF